MGVGQAAALHRLHDGDAHAMAAAGLVAGVGLDVGALPVQVVQLELHHLDLRVLVQDQLQGVGGGVEAEADVLRQAPLLGGFQEIPAPGVVNGLQLPRADAVEEEDVQVFQAGAFQLGAQDGLVVLIGADAPQGDLVHHLEAVPGVLGQQAVFDHFLAVALMVDIGGVEPAEAPGHVEVDHLLHLGVVDVLLSAAGEGGQAHEAEAQLGDGCVPGLRHKVFLRSECIGFAYFTSRARFTTGLAHFRA